MYVHIYTHTHICLYLHMCVSICIYIYVCVSSWVEADHGVQAGADAPTESPSEDLPVPTEASVFWDASAIQAMWEVSVRLWVL